MDTFLFKKLLQEQLISPSEFENVKHQHQKPLSVHSDVNTLLYIGILLFTGGLGIIVYKNIESIGHTAIIIAIATLCIFCFVYCYKKAPGYSDKKVETPNVLFDYVLLLGCLLLLTLVGYLQFEYNVFGNNWGLATFIPMIALFVTAYYFDHLAVLSMAITNLAAWAGFTIAPTKIIRDNDFHSQQLIFTGLILGVGLVAISFVSLHKKIKSHFAFTYKNFGAHILFISLLAALFLFDNIYFIWFAVLSITIFVFIKNAINEKSSYFLVVAALYFYIGLSYFVIEILSGGSTLASFYLILLYFIASGIGLIKVLIHYNKILKKNADL